MTQPLPHPEDQLVKLADPKVPFGPWVCVVCVLKYGPKSNYLYRSVEGARGHVRRLHSSLLQEDLR